jgi:hypothetical protein
MGELGRDWLRRVGVTVPVTFPTLLLSPAFCGCAVQTSSLRRLLAACVGFFIASRQVRGCVWVPRCLLANDGAALSRLRLQVCHPPM